MGKHKAKISDVARDTGLHRNTITLLYKEEANRVDLDAIEKLCRYFNCSICEMFEILDEQSE
jgi:putative transcriptional regulator